jgi:hypothetical protein
MNKLQPKRKLQLSRETLKSLSPDQLTGVEGARACRTSGVGTSDPFVCDDNSVGCSFAC